MDAPKAQPGVLRQAYSISENDDFHARFLMQMSQIRDCIVPRDKRLEFDKSYGPIHQNLYEAKYAKEKCEEIIDRHLASIVAGEDGKHHGNQIDITNPIDDEINLYFKDVFIRGSIAMNCLIRHASYLGYNINFLFEESEKKFKKGLKKFPLQHDDERFKVLSGIITGHKDAWYKQFRTIRGQIEHEGWALPRVNYRLDTNGQTEVLLPTLGSQSIHDVLEICWTNLLSLSEETLVYIMSLKLKGEMIMVSIPQDQREGPFAVRYAVRHKDFPDANFSCG